MRYRVSYISNRGTGVRAPCTRTFTCNASTPAVAIDRAYRRARHLGYTWHRTLLAEPVTDPDQVFAVSTSDSWIHNLRRWGGDRCSNV